MARDKQRGKVTWAQAFRDIFTVSMNKGQLPIMSLMLIAVIIFIRMPAEDLSKFVVLFLDMLERRYIWGYVISVLLIVGILIYTKFIRKSFTGEITRLAN